MKTQIALAFTAALLVAGSAAAADATPPPRVITVEKTATGGAIVKVDGGLSPNTSSTEPTRRFYGRSSARPARR